MRILLVTVALVALALGQASSVSGMGRASRLELRSLHLKRAYPAGHRIDFELELKNRGNVPQGIVAFGPDAFENGPPPVDLVFVVSRRSDGASFRIFRAPTDARPAGQRSGTAVLEPGEAIRARIAWTDGGQWQWLRESEWAQMHLTGEHPRRVDVLAGCFDRPGVYNVRAVVSTDRAGGGEKLWTGRLVSVPFTVYVRR